MEENKGRSLVVMGAMVIGIWRWHLLAGFVQSFTSHIQSAIKHETPNGQVHTLPLPKTTRRHSVLYKGHKPILVFLAQNQGMNR